MSENESHNHVTDEEAYKYAYDYLIEGTDIGVSEKKGFNFVLPWERTNLDKIKYALRVLALRIKWVLRKNKRPDLENSGAYLIVVCEECREKIIRSLEPAATSIIEQVPNNHAEVDSQSLPEFIEEMSEELINDARHYSMGKEKFETSLLESREEIIKLLDELEIIQNESVGDLLSAIAQTEMNEDMDEIQYAFGSAKGIRELAPNSPTTAKEQLAIIREDKARDLLQAAEVVVKSENIDEDVAITGIYLKALLGTATVIGDEEFLEKHKHLRS
jgi:hypothetical protein